MQGILLWSMNKTSTFLNECSPKKRDELVKKAIKRRKNVVKLYQDKIKTIQQDRREAVESRIKEKEAKERLLVSQTVSSTEIVLKTCGFICKTLDDVDKLIQKQKDETSRRNALLSQIKYYKCVNRGIVKGSLLFFLTSGGKPISTSQLAANLKEILHQFQVGESSISEAGSTSSVSKDKDKGRMGLKAKLLAKLNRGTATKRKCPFPADNVVGKKVKHTCLCPSGESLITYNGTVLRESTTKDVKELMEEYRSYFEKGYKFYTVIYDPPYDQLFIYPLKKEWDDNLLTII